MSDTQAYNPLSQAAVVPMVEAVAKCMLSKLSKDGLPMPDAPVISKDAFASSGNWTREQLKLAFHFYCQTPFGKLHSRNPKIIELAKLIGRTPDALAMKLVNFASLDPSITSSGRSGLKGASRLDREIWDEFNTDWEWLVIECERLRQHLLAEHQIADDVSDADSIPLADFTGETRAALVQQRVKQQFFRRAVLSSYGGSCCISGVAEPRLLVASHIVPWKADRANRLNPSNGLCLSAIHDKAFDCGLMSITENFCVLLSGELLRQDDGFIKQAFVQFSGRPITLPTRFLPDQKFLDHHRRHVFIGG